MSSLFQTIGPRGGTVPWEYEVDQPGGIDVVSVRAVFDGALASGEFRPALTIRWQNGTILCRTFPAETVAAGDDAEVTFAPFLGRGDEAGGAAVVATTVAGLGARFNGKQGLLRVGAAPYGYMRLTYDGVAAKWVSPYFQGPYIVDGTGITTTSTTYAGPLGQQRGWLGGHGDWYTAGLRLQVDGVIYLFNSGAANTTTARLAVREYDVGDTGTVALWNSQSEVSNVGTTGKFAGISWEAVTAGAPTKPLALLAWEGKVSAGTGTFAIGVGRFRWVSA